MNNERGYILHENLFEKLVEWMYIVKLNLFLRTYRENFKWEAQVMWEGEKCDWAIGSPLNGWDLNPRISSSHDCQRALFPFPLKPFEGPSGVLSSRSDVDTTRWPFGSLVLRPCGHYNSFFISISNTVWAPLPSEVPLSELHFTLLSSNLVLRSSQVCKSCLELVSFKPITAYNRSNYFEGLTYSDFGLSNYWTRMFKLIYLWWFWIFRLLIQIN